MVLDYELEEVKLVNATTANYLTQYTLGSNLSDYAFIVLNTNYGGWTDNLILPTSFLGGTYKMSTNGGTGNVRVDISSGKVTFTKLDSNLPNIINYSVCGYKKKVKYISPT